MNAFERGIMDSQEFKDLLGKQESQNVEEAESFREATWDALSHEGGMEGLKLPWVKTHNEFALRKGEVTVWAGVNGHGKSLILGQVCAQTITEAKWLIASMEMFPHKTLARMAKQIGGIGNPTREYFDKCYNTLDDRLWIYDQMDSVPWQNMIAMIKYSAKYYGVEYFIIDSLVKCGIRSDDFNAQKDFIDALCITAKTYNININLVHHVRKGEREGKKPDKFDVKGAGEITDLVDNLVIVHRNKDKERMKRDGDKGYEAHHFDVSVEIAKQRHAGIEETYGLYYQADSEQFTEHQRVSPPIIC